MKLARSNLLSESEIPENNTNFTKTSSMKLDEKHMDESFENIINNIPKIGKESIEVTNEVVRCIACLTCQKCKLWGNNPIKRPKGSYKILEWHAFIPK